MTNATVSHKPCPLCGGTLTHQTASIPFVLGKTIAVVKEAPAEVCDACGEAFLDGDATDRVTAMLRAARDANAEVLVMHISTGRNCCLTTIGQPGRAESRARAVLSRPVA